MSRPYNQYDSNLHVQLPGKFSKAATPSGIPYQRFLNCDVKGFNLNLGFGASETTMTMDLVESLEVGNSPADQTYSDFKSTCGRTTAAAGCTQQRYTGDLGHVYTFEAEDLKHNEIFEFSGLLSDHDIKIDSNGRTISLRLTDGRSLLDNVTLIVGSNYSRNTIYNAAGNSVNTMNLLYEIERGVAANFDVTSNFNTGALTDGISTFSKCDYFMDSGADEDGMPVTYILGQFLSSRYITLPLSDQKLKINLDNIYANAITRAPFLRISDSSISLQSLLQQVCDEMAGEFIINIVKVANDGITDYEIVATFIDRSQPLPTNGFSLGTYIQNNFPTYKSLSYGQESSYESTQNIVFGSKLRYFAEIQRGTQHPMFNTLPTTSFTQETINPQNPPDLETNFQDKIVAQDTSDPPEDSCYDPDDFQGDNGITCNLPTGGGRIAMVLGERLNGGLNDQGIPAYTLYLSNLCGDYMGVMYDISDLGAILGFPGLGSATLTEEELLFTQTYESYINWSTMHPKSIGYTLGSLIFGSLWGNFQEYSLKIFADIVDNGSFDSFRDPALAFPDAEVSKKQFEVVHAYVKNIYDNFYGKEYVALVDRKVTNTTSAINDFDICIGKSFNTWSSTTPGASFPQANANVSIPKNDPVKFIASGVLSNVIKTAGQGYLSTSETVCQGAWFNDPAQSKILQDELGKGGLGTTNGLSRFLNDDNTIGSFIKYGPVNNICKRIGNVTFSFRVDISALNPSEFVIDVEDGIEMLYLRASMKEEMYFGSLDLGVTAGVNDIGTLYGLGALTDDNTWIRFSIPRIKLIPTMGTNQAVNRATSRMALIALQVMTDVKIMSGVLSGSGTTLANAIKDKLAGGGINPGVFDGIASNLAVTNLAKISVPAVIPEAVAIPLQSEVMTYGPWKGMSNPSGGITVTEEDLAPWHYGLGALANITSFQLMQNAGISLAANGTYGRLYQEKATLDVPGIPKFNLATATTLDAGTVLTDISFGYGADGARTSMTYQTYSPKFGSTPSYLVEAQKQAISQKLDYMKQFRGERLRNAATSLKLKEDLGKIMVGRNVGGGGGAGVEDGTYNSRYGHTPSKFLMTGYLNKNDEKDIENNAGGRASIGVERKTHDYTDSCTDIDTNPFPYTDTQVAANSGNSCTRYAAAELHPTYNFDSSQKEYYKNMSLMSLDGMYLPVSLEGGTNNNLVRYTNYSGTTTSSLPVGRPITMMPPVTISSNGGGGTALDLVIDQKYTNPICSKAILSTWDTRKNNSDQGFVIMNVAHGDNPDDNFNFDSITGLDGTISKNRQDATDFRFNAMRGPLVLQAWGYDINGMPIPNANDSAADTETGTFRSNNLQNKFLTNWLNNPKTWPVGPIDLRWDRNRGMWVAPPSSKIIIGRLTSSLSPYGTATAELLNPESGGVKFYKDYDIYGPDGTTLTEDVRNLTVTVHDYVGSTISKCAIILMYYSDGKYMVIEEGGTNRNLQRARISSGQTLACNGQCLGELFTVSVGGGITYGDTAGITISDTMGIVSQPLASLTRMWVYKAPDASNYEVVYIGSRTDADCGSCGGFGVYQIAGVDFNRLPTVQTVGRVLTVTDGGCLAMVGTKGCAGIESE